MDTQFGGVRALPGSTDAIVNRFCREVKLRRVALYSSRAGSCLPGCQLGAKPSGGVSIWVLAVVEPGSMVSVQMCLRRHSRHSFSALGSSVWNCAPQLHRSRIIHLAILCRRRLLGRVLGR